MNWKQSRNQYGVFILAIFGLIWFMSGRARAHVQYVTPGGEPAAVVTFLLNALFDPVNIALLIGGAVSALLVGRGYLRYRPLQRDIAVFRDTMLSYADLLPWMLRLSIGLPLVGAGFSGYFFSPVVVIGPPAFIRLFGVTTGFLLLFGFGTRLVAFVTLLAYLNVLLIEPRLLLAVEYVPALAAIALLGGGRPSADQLVARLAARDTVYSRIDPFYRAVAVPFVRRVSDYTILVPAVVRIGMGLSFLYLGISQKIMNPGDAAAVVAKYNLTAVVPVSPELWVVGAGLTEAAVGFVLIVGAFTRAAAGISFLLFTTTLFGLPDDPVLAHISLFGLASALLIMGGGAYSIDSFIGARTEVSLTTDIAEEPPDPATAD